MRIQFLFKENLPGCLLAGLLSTMLFSPAVHALGLGDAQLRSYLGEPLNVQIRLISRSSEELATVTAGLASASDIAVMGLSRTVSVPLNFRVNAEQDNSYIEVRSRLPVTDPVLQLVVEVTWSGGRMLREYTMFLDPPTFASKAPVPMVSPKSDRRLTTDEPVVTAPSPAPQSTVRDFPDPATLNTVEKAGPVVLQSQTTEQSNPRLTDVAVDQQPSRATMTEDLAGTGTQSPEILPEPDSMENTPQTVTVPDAPLPAAEPGPQPADATPDLAEISHRTEQAADAEIQQAPAADAMELEATIDQGAIELADQVASEELEAEGEADRAKVAAIAAPGARDQEAADSSTADVELEQLAGSGHAETSDELADPASGDVDATETETDMGTGTQDAVDAVADARSEEPVASEASLNEVQQPKVELPEPEPAYPVDSSVEDSGEVLGPVERGQTLWGIASHYSSGSQYSINQAMLAIQRLNPDAFGGNNINSLRRGAILRMPTFREMGRVSERQAMVEAIRQEQVYLAMRSGQALQDVPVIADTGVESTDSSMQSEPGDTTLAANSEARLQLVPPSESDGPEGGTGGVADQPTGAMSSQEVEEVLARTEEELANAQQENEYLNERIRELEAQLATGGDGGTVEDSELAGMEESLREERLAGENNEPEETLPAEPAKPWYQRSAWWFGGLLIVMVAGVIWFLRRLATGNSDGGGPGDRQHETVKSIRSEAEEILETLDEKSDDGEGRAGDNVIDLESYVEPEEREVPESHNDEAEPAADNAAEDAAEDDAKAEHSTPQSTRPADNEEAVELDSDDPEVKLDLARAYISMGDKESAREMLDDVLVIGNKDQQREAREMMEEI